MGGRDRPHEFCRDLPPVCEIDPDFNIPSPAAGHRVLMTAPIRRWRRWITGQAMATSPPPLPSSTMVSGFVALFVFIPVADVWRGLGRRADALHPRSVPPVTCAMSAADPERAAFLAELDMDNYDDEPGILMTGAGMSGLMYHGSNNEDPYITLPSSDDDSGPLVIRV